MARLDVYECDGCGNRIEGSGFEIRLFAYPLLTTQEQMAIMDVKKGRRTSLYQATEQWCHTCTQEKWGENG